VDKEAVNKNLTLKNTRNPRLAQKGKEAPKGRWKSQWQWRFFYSNEGLDEKKINPAARQSRCGPPVGHDGRRKMDNLYQFGKAIEQIAA
jgi:hypothetical protein